MHTVQIASKTHDLGSTQEQAKIAADLHSWTRIWGYLWGTGTDVLNGFELKQVYNSRQQQREINNTNCTNSSNVNSVFYLLLYYCIRTNSRLIHYQNTYDTYMLDNLETTQNLDETASNQLII